MFQSLAEASSKNFASNVETVCVTCLSADRVVYSMRFLPDLFDVCSNLSLMMEDHICWECKALLTRMLNFRTKALKSKTILAQMTLLNKMPVHMQSLSSLTVTLNTSFDCDLKETIKEESLNKHAADAFVKDELYEEEVYVMSPITNETEKENDDATTTDEPSRICTVIKYDDEDQIDFEDNDLKQLASPSLSDDVVDDVQSGIISRTLDEAEMKAFREKQRSQRYYKICLYKCDDCILLFSSHKMLIQHLKAHSESNGPFKCDVCEMRFSDSNTLKTHKKVHYTYYECSDCKWTHPCLQNIRNHRMKNHGNKILQCDQCDAQFMIAHKLRYHMRSEHAAKPTCDQCGKAFSSTCTLKRHKILHSEVPQVECDICHKTYRGEWGLKAHMRTHNKTVNEHAYCAECNKQFKNIYLYKVHLKQNKRHATEEAAKYECADCGKRFISKSNMTDHIEVTHLKLGKHVCEVCDTAHNSMKTLSRHRREKHECKIKKRSNVCHICGKAFLHKGTLQQHMNKHLGARPYRCHICHATFAYSAALYNHNRLVHLKEKRPKKKIKS